MEAVLEREQLLQALQSRYATKQFDPTKKISPENWDVLEESLRLAPSSFGFQLWKFVVISSREVLERLRAVSQAQVLDCSHLVVIAIPSNPSAESCLELVRETARTRGVSVESLKKYEDSLTSWWLATEGTVDRKAWMARQAYIPLGMFLTSAALLGIDTSPMEGFDKEKFNEILGLDGYESIVMVAAGYHLESDKYAKLPKVRYPKEKVITRF